MFYFLIKKICLKTQINTNTFYLISFSDIIYYSSKLIFLIEKKTIIFVSKTIDKSERIHFLLFILRQNKLQVLNALNKKDFT